MPTPTNPTIDFNTGVDQRNSSNNIFSLNSYTVATRPTASSLIGIPIWISDKKTLMISTGTSWINIGAAIGSVHAFSGSTVPDGYIFANGATGKSLVTNPELTDLFNYWGGAIYGGTGNTSFTLPDYQGQFLRGWANGSANDPDRALRTNRGDGTAGDIIGTKQAGQIQSHSHTLTRPKWYSSDSNTAAGSIYGQISATTQSFYGIDIGSFGGNQTNPININVMYCIKL